MTRDRYTRYPRPILWLVPGGELGGVEIEPFYISKLPVTNEQYEAFARVAGRGFGRSAVAPGDRDPAIGLSAADARAYCDWYAGVARKPLRLPSEAEWEYACRGGAATRYPWGDAIEHADEHAWSAESTPPGPLPPLDGKKANGFGLYAMLGGVWEWVETGAAGAEGSATNGEAVLRGGSYRTPVSELCCSLRRSAAAEEPIADAGFRVVKSLRARRGGA